jgi:hypothetical protein
MFGMSGLFFHGVGLPYGFVPSIKVRPLPVPGGKMMTSHLEERSAVLAMSSALM